MSANSLATSIDPATAAATMSPFAKLLMLVGNTIAFLQSVIIAGLIWWFWRSPWICAGAVLAFVYLLPPLLCRLILLIMPVRRPIIPLGSRDFLVWWFVLNLQMLFCRFPFLEEILRVVPSCYSLWLRLWGAKVGKLTYWAAGLRILDRSFVRIGDHVTFGAGVRLNPHVVMPDDDGRMVLVLAPVTIGDRVSVGGYSLLVAGTEVAADQCTRAFTILPPFHRIENGQRHKPTESLSLASEQADPAGEV